MAHINLSGMGVALITPFNDDYSIDTAALAAHTDYVIRGGADYLVALGTTAETPTLSHTEREIVKQTIKEANNGRVPMVIGIGGNCTEAVAAEIADSDLSGFDAILSVVPFYNKPGQKGIEEHYRHIAHVSPLPIVLYNVPGRTGVNMTAETTLALAGEENIIAVKEASGSLQQIERIIRLAPADFQVISGDDGITLPLMAMGAQGVISVAGNVIPSQFASMVHSCMQGEYHEARAMHHSFYKLFELLFKDGNPAGAKAALAGVGKIKNVLRLPLTPVSETTSSELRSVVEAIIG